jgi:ABC-type glutathione transport system ATPase component
LLEVRNLEVGYISGKTQSAVLKGVSLDVAAGDSVGLLGTSGCGKTTLLLSILGLLPSNARVRRGSICLDGIELVGLTEAAFRPIRSARMALVSQDPALALNPVLCAGEQVVDVLRAHRAWPRARYINEAKRLMAEVGLRDIDRVFKSYPHELSGGQLQRIVIAQAIACEPALLLADEPTASLDFESQAGILKLLLQLQEEHGMGLIIVTHDVTTLAELRTRIFIMKEGRLEQRLDRDRRPAVILPPVLEATG